jgi:hypothetical protein
VIAARVGGAWYRYFTVCAGVSSITDAGVARAISGIKAVTSILARIEAASERNVANGASPRLAADTMVKRLDAAVCALQRSRFIAGCWVTATRVLELAVDTGVTRYTLARVIGVVSVVDAGSCIFARVQCARNWDLAPLSGVGLVTVARIIREIVGCRFRTVTGCYAVYRARIQAARERNIADGSGEVGRAEALEI